MPTDIEHTDWGEPIYAPEDLRRGRYPPEIEPRVDLDDPTEFNTEHQHKVAGHIWENPNTPFLDLEEEYGNSRNSYSKVYKRYFGPPNSGRSFGEIEEEFGTYRNYLAQLRDGQIDDPRGESMSIDEGDILSRLGLDGTHFSSRDKRMIRIGAELVLAECEASGSGAAALE